VSGPRFVVKALDRYFGTQVSQDIKRRVAACFVALDQEGSIAGYYTLASASVSLADLPAPLMKKLPRYPSVPAVRMGRLAVARSCQGIGLGRRYCLTRYVAQWQRRLQPMRCWLMQKINPPRDFIGTTDASLHRHSRGSFSYRWLVSKR
jgi:hypothetical protein